MCGVWNLRISNNAVTKGGWGIGLHFGGEVFLGAAGIVVKLRVVSIFSLHTGSGVLRILVLGASHAWPMGKGHVLGRAELNTGVCS